MVPWMTIYGQTQIVQMRIFSRYRKRSVLQKSVWRRIAENLLFMVSWQPYARPCTFMVLTGTMKLYGLGYGCQEFF